MTGLDLDIARSPGNAHAVLELLAFRQAWISGSLGFLFASMIIAFFAVSELSPELMAARIFGRFPLGWLLGVAMLAAGMVITGIFNHYSRTVLDPLREEAIELIARGHRGVQK
ncbi:DUF485 domain-containing protein [Paraburkholderia sediminicola]|uniref:DUF485 domain-containing protein n=1 Tax=Paraburkholderia metrosideri TaxID=580937 RepID=A0ABW9DYR8_9BURK